jgi:hypothetical protein
MRPWSARKVSNEGTIIARTVALAAGNRVALDMIGDGLISVRIEQAALGAAALNSGTIVAEGGSVYLAARSADALLDTVVNNTGIIRANSLVERNGSIILDGGSHGVVANSGTLDVSGKEAGTTGGTVKVLGEYVGLFAARHRRFRRRRRRTVWWAATSTASAPTEREGNLRRERHRHQRRRHQLRQQRRGRDLVQQRHRVLRRRQRSQRRPVDGGFVEISGKVRSSRVMSTPGRRRAGRTTCCSTARSVHHRRRCRRSRRDAGRLRHFLHRICRRQHPEQHPLRGPASRLQGTNITLQATTPSGLVQQTGTTTAAVDLSGR